MTQILVTPEQLVAQSAEMANIRNEFDGLQQQLSNALIRMNEAWSPNMSNNFSSKITSAQKSFMSVLNMLDNGSAAARIGANTFDGNIDGVMAAMAENPSLADWLGKHADEMTDFTANFIGTALGSESFKNSEKILYEAADKVQNGDFAGALKQVLNQGADITSEAVTGNFITGTVFKGLKALTKVDLKDHAESFMKDTAHDYNEKLGQWFEQVGSGDISGALKTTAESAFVMPWNILKSGLDLGADISDTWFGTSVNQDALKNLGDIEGTIYTLCTGDSAGAAYVRNYYQDQGGVIPGVVNGLGELGSYAVERVGDFISALL